jgi:rRNA maturation endonuclease Nob1
MDVADEIKEIKSMLERIEAVIDARLVGVEEPDEDEVAEIRDYAKRKKEGSIELREI